MYNIYIYIYIYIYSIYKNIKIIRLQKKLIIWRYKSLPKERKEKKQHYGCEQYKNLPKDEKQKLVEF